MSALRVAIGWIMKQLQWVMNVAVQEEGTPPQYLHHRRDNWSPPCWHVKPPCVRAAQLRASHWRSDRWAAARDRQRKGRVSHCSPITKSNVDTRTQPFVKYGWRDFISVWSFHGSVWGWNYSRLRPLVPFLQLRLMLKATVIGCREQQKRQNIAKEAPDLSASTVLPSLSACDHSLFHPLPH